MRTSRPKPASFKRIGFCVLFQPLTDVTAKTKGEAEAKTRAGFAEGMFSVKPRDAPGLSSSTYEIKVDCPKGFKPLGKLTVTSYFIADESQFPENSTVKEPCWLKGAFREQFLHKAKGDAPLGVDMEGSGRTLTGQIQRG